MLSVQYLICTGFPAQNLHSFSYSHIIIKLQINLFMFRYLQYIMLPPLSINVFTLDMMCMVINLGSKWEARDAGMDIRTIPVHSSFLPASPYSILPSLPFLRLPLHLLPYLYTRHKTRDRDRDSGVRDRDRDSGVRDRDEDTRSETVQNECNAHWPSRNNFSQVLKSNSRVKSLKSADH